ncbi:MAG TPA: von Willebrand factor type A domain-containing protein [Opitutaceae bacterium]|nr:von Willebrand factor type A domain-containing protein [Opitutaceae bacterium]
MNHDENNPDLQTFIEPGLEARLVAAVLGETSAFENAELDRLATEKPELAIFKRRIEAVHGLVGHAVRPEQAPLRLAPERRAKILQAIGATPARVPGGDTNMPILLALAEARRKRRKKWIWGSSLAASVTLASFLTLSAFQKNYMRSTEKVALNNARQLETRANQYLMETDRMKSVTTADSLRVNEPQAVQAPADDIIQLQPFQIEKKQSLTSKLRKALTSPASPAESADMSFSRVDAPSRTEMSVVAGEGDNFAAAPAAVGGAASASAWKIGQDNNAFLAPKQKEFGVKGATSPMNRSFGIADQERRSAAKPVVAADAYGKTDARDVRGLLQALPGSTAKREAAPAPDQTALGPMPKDQGVVENEIVVMSPHTVEAAREGGYAAASSLAGSRTQSEQLQLSPFSVSSSRSGRRSPTRVASRPPLADTAAVDINDNFLFDAKANTEGSALRAEEGLGLSAAAMDEQLSQQKAAATPPPPTPAEAPNGEIRAAKEAVSTFSLHVSDVSFRLAQAALARGETPDPARIRPEEFYNAFDYGDPAPTAADKISSRIEQAAHPLLQQRNLVRIAVKVGATGRGASQPLHLTVLLDTSGSMEREDRIASVRRALDVLASLLGANDRVTLIGFSRQPHLLAEQLPGNQAANLSAFAANTPYTGGTNLEEALKLAGQLARRHQSAAAQNRIVLITDGAANLGNADPAQLAKMIEALRQQGIAFDACGVGTDGLDDSILEALTRKGDGRYYVLDSAADADAGFARQLAGAFRPAAENVKVQVRFNPARVGSYRLIGFEQHRLREEDFRNDKVDAAELAAEEAAVALYQVEVLPQGEGEVGEVFVRFRDAAGSNMVERSWTIRHEPQAKAFDRATPTMQLAGTAALMAEKLRGGDSANLIELSDLAPVVNSLRGQYSTDVRVQELVTMFERMRRRAGK